VTQALTDDDPHSLGVFRLLGRLGMGGQGIVYLGTDPAGERVAIKLLHARLAAEPRARDRFLREVMMAQRVARFCTAPVLHADLAGSRPYVVSEYGPGSTVPVITPDTSGSPNPHRTARVSHQASGTEPAAWPTRTTSPAHRRTTRPGPEPTNRTTDRPTSEPTATRTTTRPSPTPPDPTPTKKPSPKPNPYSAAGVCGSGYQVIDSHSYGPATTYLLYHAGVKNNCVITLSKYVMPDKVRMSAVLQVSGGGSGADTGSFTVYAGPIRLAAAGKCVIWGGGYGSADWKSGWSHCG
jgi:Serine/threonine protein kinase